MIAMLPQRTRVFRPRPQLAAVQLAQVTIFLHRDLQVPTVAKCLSNFCACAVPAADKAIIAIKKLRNAIPLDTCLSDGVLRSARVEELRPL